MTPRCETSLEKEIAEPDCHLHGNGQVKVHG